MCRLVIIVSTETEKDEEWTRKEGQVSEMSVWVTVSCFSLFNFLYLCAIFCSELPCFCHVN
jgi:hypothetical protein